MATFQSFSRALRPSTSIGNSTQDYVCLSCRRHASSFRRTRKALRIGPDESFVPSQAETQDHIIFNPPSSAPSVYHTPTKFLPQGDPRRKMHSFASGHASASSIVPTASTGPSSTSAHGSMRTAKLPPTVRKPYEKKYHLSAEQIEEIKKLRKEDPRKWTRVKLAEKFECSQFFVSLCCCAPEIKAERDKELEEIKKRWGRRKTEAREDRQTRKAAWGRAV